MCWRSRSDDLFDGCAHQHALLMREYGPNVLRVARCYASRLSSPLSRLDKLACISLAQKFMEDEPLTRWHLFPGVSHATLTAVEWNVLLQLNYRLTP